jgi:hypothetical protein
MYISLRLLIGCLISLKNRRWIFIQRLFFKIALLSLKVLYQTYLKGKSTIFPATFGPTSGRMESAVPVF